MSHDAMSAFGYPMRALPREPVWVVIIVIQPLCYLARFEPISKTRGFHLRRLIGLSSRPDARAAFCNALGDSSLVIGLVCRRARSDRPSGSQPAHSSANRCNTHSRNRVIPPT